MNSATWLHLRSRYLFSHRDVRGVDAPLASATIDGVVLRDDLQNSVWNPGSDVSGYKLVEPDDFVIGLRSFQHGISHSAVRGIVSPAYTVLRGTRSVDPRFYRYYFKSAIFISRLNNLTQGIRQGQAIDLEAFADLEIPVPPRDEQRRIADFLDREASRIDKLINAISEESNLLHSKRRSLLASAFQSDGHIGARIGYYLELVTSGPRGWSDYVSSRGTPFFRSANIRRDEIEPNLEDLVLVDLPRSTAAEAVRSRIHVGDVLIGITGANTGWVSLADERIDQANVSQHVCLVRPGKAIDGRWFAYALSSPQVQELLLGSQYGGTKTQLSLSNIRDLTLRLPSLDIQQTTSSAISERLAAITAARALRDRELALLAERHQALITSMFTGQIDLATARGAAA